MLNVRPVSTYGSRVNSAHPNHADHILTTTLVLAQLYWGEIEEPVPRYSALLPPQSTVAWGSEAAGTSKPDWVLQRLSLTSPTSRVWDALRSSSPQLEGTCPCPLPFWTAQPMASAASFHRFVEDTQRPLTHCCYTLEGVILYGIDSYALWGIYNIPSWDFLGVGSTDTLRNNQNYLQKFPWTQNQSLLRITEGNCLREVQPLA